MLGKRAGARGTVCIGGAVQFGLDKGAGAVVCGLGNDAIEDCRPTAGGLAKDELATGEYLCASCIDRWTSCWEKLEIPSAREIRGH